MKGCGRAPCGTETAQAARLCWCSTTAVWGTETPLQGCSSRQGALLGPREAAASPMWLCAICRCHLGRSRGVLARNRAFSQQCSISSLEASRQALPCLGLAFVQRRGGGAVLVQSQSTAATFGEGCWLPPVAAAFLLASCAAVRLLLHVSFSTCPRCSAELLVLLPSGVACVCSERALS